MLNLVGEQELDCYGAQARAVEPATTAPNGAEAAISTAYYALFHAMAKDAADLLVGVGPNRPRIAWSHIYRSLQHGDAKNACEALRNLSFPATIIACGEAFVTLQQQRHDADYNPDYRVLRADALAAIDRAEKAIKDLRSATRHDRKTFAVRLLHKKRR